VGTEGESTTPKGSPDMDGGAEGPGGEEGEDGEGGKEKGAWTKEQMRKQIRDDIDELVKGASFPSSSPIKLSTHSTAR